MKRNKLRSNVHIWMRYNPDITDEEWKARFKRLDYLRIHRVFLSGDFGQELIQYARKYKIEIHAWRSIVQNDDPDLIANHPDWYMVNRIGMSCAGNTNWLCMNNPLAVNHVYTIIERLCQMDHLDGIHMDTIRYPQIKLFDGELQQPIEDQAIHDFCYCPHCRRKFRRKTGHDPLDLAEPDTNQAWIDFRIQTIDNVVKQIAHIVRSYREAITAIVLPTPEIGRTMAFQAWDQWDLDAFYPALFNDFFLEGSQWLSRCIHEGMNAVSIPLYAALHLPSFSAEMLDIALDASWEANGSALFAYENLRHEHEDVLKRRRYL